MPKTTDVNEESRLLGSDEAPPYEVFNQNGQAKCIIVCDHASNAVPKKLDNLGLSTEALNKHSALDIGARGVAQKLAELIDAQCVLANYSRLVIDLNRYLDHSTAILASCEDDMVPGNVDLAEEDRLSRINEIYEPYHAEIESRIKSFRDRDIVPVIISIHSFTRSFFNQERPWELGVLWVQDGRIAVPSIRRLREKGFNVGDNEPYDARMLWGTTVNAHADAHGFPNILFEIRNDLISTAADEEKIAKALAESISPELEDQDLYSLYEGERPVHDPALAESYFDELVQKAKQGE